jgi:hypothetical protein
MDRYTRDEIRAATFFAEGRGLSTEEFIAKQREQDREKVAAAVAMARSGSFGALSVGEQCAAALVLPRYRDAYGSIERTARRCGLEWLRAVRDLHPDAVGLDLIPPLEAEDAGAPVINCEEEMIGQVEAARVRTMTKEDIAALHAEASAGCASRGIVREERRYVIFWQSEAVGTSNEERPRGWRPGAVALDINGVAHLASGGNYHDGATHWVKITPSETVS